MGLRRSIAERRDPVRLTLLHEASANGLHAGSQDSFSWRSSMRRVSTPLEVIMFGFVFGTACLVGLAFVVGRGRRRHWGRHFGGPFGRGALYGALERLETTPGQEKVITQAVSDVKETAWRARSIARAREEGRRASGPGRDLRRERPPRGIPRARRGHRRDPRGARRRRPAGCTRRSTNGSARSSAS